MHLFFLLFFVEKEQEILEFSNLSGSLLQRNIRNNLNLYKKEDVPISWKGKLAKL